MCLMDDQTRRIPQANSDDQTEYMGSTSPAPRQYMPNEDNQTAYIGNYSPEYEDRYSEPQPYDEPYHPGGYNGQGQHDQYGQQFAPDNAEKTNNTTIVLGVIAVLVALAGVVLFFLWRGAESRANQPPPAPVTLTETETVTTGKDSFWESLFNSEKDGDGEVTLPTEIPKDLPTEIPTEVPEDVRDDFQSMLDDLKKIIDDMKASN